MSYRVLVVDDEPIILSGIRHLIDWKSVDAEIIGTAANGSDAYEIIERDHPDIVITDIRMPVMDGLALAGKCSETFPDIVFIILTSLAEFGLAKEAIRYGISDYLLKTELDGERLQKALVKAEDECTRRRGDAVASSESADDRTAGIISNLFIMRDVSQEIRTFLSDKGLLSGFAFISVVFSFPSPSLEKQWNADDYRRLRGWQQDVVEKILPSFFDKFWRVIPVSGKEGTLIYFVSGLSSDTWTAVSSRVAGRIDSASSMVTGLSPVLLRTEVMSGRENLRHCRDQMEQQLMAFYLDKDIQAISPSSLDVDSVFPRLELAISNKETAGVKACFSLLRNAIASSDHGLSQFEFTVSALRSALSSGLSSIGLRNDTEMFDVFDTVDFITKRSEALAFIDDAENSVVMLLGSRGGSGSGVADKAREYVLSHIMEKITLGDVAEYACVSPSYMSKSFKRIMGISLVDYINTMKIERAKEMMGEGRDDRIADIALALGFSNIYYFSKVFRKVEGVPPTEYIKKHTIS